MSFNEKLQNLRKKNRMSQEELADKLDVTRQSVSKWESGITYPEMDKLLSICKIFNCSLDELTNDNVKEIGQEKKTNINILVDSILDIINRTYHYFLKITFKDFIKCILVMTIVFLILLLLKQPISGIEDSIYNMFDSFKKPELTNFGYYFFKLIFDIVYYVLFVLLFIYIFKIGFLDKANINLKEDNQVEDLSESDSIVESKDIKASKKGKEHSYQFFNILGSIIMFFVKILLVCIAVPFVLLLIFLFICLVFDFYLIFKGLFYSSILLGIISSITLDILLLEFIFNILFNKKHAYKRMLITFFAGICTLGLSIGLLTLDFNNIKYYSSAPSEKVKTTSYVFDYNDKLYFDNYHQTEYVVDNTMKNNVKIDAIYYPKYYNLSLKQEDNEIEVIDSNTDYIRVNAIIDLIISDLKTKKIYNYDLLYEPKFVVTTSDSNIQKIKENELVSYEDNNNDVTNYEDELDNLEEKNSNLIEQNDKLKDENNELRETLNEIKSEIDSLLKEKELN